MTDRIEVEDFEWALFSGDTQVTSWLPNGTTMIPGPGVTVTEICYRFLGREVRTPFIQTLRPGSLVDPGRVTFEAAESSNDYLLLAALSDRDEETT